MEADKRAHHNALERKRRDHIKDSFTSLRESVPSLQNEKVASRAQILKKASDYIQFMRRKNNAHQKDIDDLKKQNALLESQIRYLEKAKASNAFPSEGNDSLLKSDRSLQDRNSDSESEGSDSDTSVTPSRRAKKVKVGGAGRKPL